MKGTGAGQVQIQKQGEGQRQEKRYMLVQGLRKVKDVYRYTETATRTGADIRSVTIYT